MKGKSNLITVAVILIALLMVALSLAGASCTAKPKEVVKLVGITGMPKSNDTFAPYVSVAKQLGWLAEDGIDVEMNTLPTDTGYAMVQQGQADYHFYNVDGLVAMEAKGKPTNAVGAFRYFHHNWFRLATIADGPVKTLADLKGKKVALEFLDITQTTWVSKWLATVGLTIKDVEIVQAGADISGAEALKKGQISAYLSAYGKYVGWENIGYKFLYFPDFPGIEKAPGPTFWIRSETLKDPAKVEALGKYFKNVAKSLIFLRYNPEAVIRLHWKNFPEAKSTTISEADAIKGAINSYAAVAKYTGKPDAGWGSLTPADIKMSADFFDIKGLSDDVYKRMSTDVFLKATNNFNEAEVIKFAQSYKVK